MRVTSKSSKTAKGDPMCKWVLLFTSNSFTFSLNITVSQGQGQENPKDLQIYGSLRHNMTILIGNGRFCFELTVVLFIFSPAQMT